MKKKMNKKAKILGQNFLTSKRIVRDIVAAADIKPDDVVLEVGPGKGVLTEAILEKIPNVRLIAVEKDKRLAEFLDKKFAEKKKIEIIPKSSDRRKVVYSHLEIIHGDILKFSIFKFQFSNYKIVANIPYYITSRFLRKFLESDFQPSKMVLMVQKEVAERIIAKDKKESILSISVKAYGEPKIIKKVPAGCFFPKPKVDSAILLIDNISKDFFMGMRAEKFVSLRTDITGKPTETKLLGACEQSFFELVRAGFLHKRKLLKSNLKNVKHSVFDIEKVFEKCGISEKARAEDLKLGDWRCLAKSLHFSEDIV